MTRKKSGDSALRTISNRPQVRFCHRPSPVQLREKSNRHDCRFKWERDDTSTSCATSFLVFRGGSSFKDCPSYLFADKSTANLIQVSLVVDINSDTVNRHEHMHCFVGPVEHALSVLSSVPIHCCSRIHTSPVFLHNNACHDIPAQKNMK